MRKICGLLLSVTVSLTVFSALASPAGASAATDASRFVALTNQTRAQHGLPALTVSGTLVGIAQGWSDHMAAAGTISHNPNLSAQAPSNWQNLGENVGMGGSVDAIEQAFLNSPHHYTNIVSPDFREVGIAVTYSGSTLFVTVDFMRTFQDTAAAPAPAPAPRPAAAPRPMYPVAAQPVAARPAAVPAAVPVANGPGVTSPPAVVAAVSTPAPAAGAPPVPSRQLAIVMSQLHALDQQSS
jgi:hypothetical protein